MGNKVQTICLWSGVAFLVTYLAFFLGVAGYIPPSPPSWDPATVAAFYNDHRYSIRVGQVGALIASTLLFPFWALISAQIGRIEVRQGRLPLLALMQICGAILLQVFFVVCSMMWIIATYRPELDPGTLRMLHDGGWLVFVMVFPAYVMQMFCLAAVSFIDDSDDPWMPRWAGYMNLWVGVAGTGGGIAVFFYNGAFAWNGLIGFYIPAGVFAIWMLIMTHLMRAHRKRQEAAGQPAAAAAERALVG